MSRILLLVNGLGLGNSTRCYAVIQRLLAADAEVEVVTSDNGLWFFADKPEVGRATEIPSLRYGQKAGRIDIAATLSQVGTMLDTIRRAEAVLADTIARFRPAAVVTDSIYSLRPVRRAGLPLAAINNSDMVVRRMVGRRMAGRGATTVSSGRAERLSAPSSAPRFGDQPPPRSRRHERSRALSPSRAHCSRRMPPGTGAQRPARTGGGDAIGLGVRQPGGARARPPWLDH